MSDNEHILHTEDFAHFRKWIDLNLNSVTWQGRYKDEFEEFWEIFFVDGLSLAQIGDRFDYAILQSSIGTLSSWFVWLKDRFICYVFIYKGLSVFQISSQTDIPLGKVAGILRNFLFEKYPHLDRSFSDKLQINNMSSDNLHLVYKDLIEELDVSKEISGRVENDIMPSLEITLYDEWATFLKKIKQTFYYPNFNFAKLKRGMGFRRHLVVVRDLVSLVVIGTALVYAVQYINKKYESSLTEKISAYEPQFKWLDKTLTFKAQTASNEEVLPDNVKDIESADQSKNVLLSEDFVAEPERLDVESETVLTSWDSLPKDFDVVGYEQSQYEELGKKGYRESRYGSTRVYRVLIRSGDMMQTRNYLNNLVEKYDVTQVDHVRPGITVPGGIYYNLYVPKIHLKEFMAQVTEEYDATLYLSKTHTRRSPPDKSKVFIWIKSI